MWVGTVYRTTEQMWVLKSLSGAANRGRLFLSQRTKTAQAPVWISPETTFVHQGEKPWDFHEKIVWEEKQAYFPENQVKFSNGKSRGVWPSPGLLGWPMLTSLLQAPPQGRDQPGRSLVNTRCSINVSFVSKVKKENFCRNWNLRKKYQPIQSFWEW